MSKQNVAKLLARLKDNQAKDIENAASIYTVAQVAVNALEQSEDLQPEPIALPEPVRVTKHELLERYHSFNGCRSEAKKQGIKFSKTPSWAKLEAAFSHRETVEQLVQSYFANFPDQSLEGISFEISLRG